VDGSLDGTASPKDGAFAGFGLDADQMYREASRRTFTAAKVSEVSFPALDGGAQQAGLVSVKIDGTFGAQASGSLHRPNVKPPAQKGFDTSQFSLSFDGGISETGVVVDAFTVKPGQRTAMTFHVPAAHRQPYDTWQSSAAHKQGSLEFLSPANELSSASRTSRLRRPPSSRFPTG